MSQWQTISFYKLDSIPANPGVYAIYNESDLVYIGQAVDLLARMRRHRYVVLGTKEPSTRWDKDGLEVYERKNLRVKYRLSKKVGEWLSAEFRLVSRLQPLLNTRKLLWSDVLHRLKTETHGRRTMQLGDFCLLCKTEKKPRYMASKNWCNACASHNPRAWRASGELKRGHSTKHVAKTLVPRGSRTVRMPALSELRVDSAT